MVAGARLDVAKGRRMVTRLVVALDVPTFERAERLIDALAGVDLTFKVGMEAFYGYGQRLLAAARGA